MSYITKTDIYTTLYIIRCIMLLQIAYMCARCHFNSIQFNINCITYRHIYINTVTKKNHEYSEEVTTK